MDCPFNCNCAAAAAEMERLRAECAGEYERGYREALEVVANEIDCGGPSACEAMKMKDGTCIRSVSKDCMHDEAEYVRSLAPPARPR